MPSKQSHSRGFTLIAALLLLLLLTGIAVGLMFMVNTETRVGGNDLENNLAYYGAEAGMEKMTADLGNLYTINQSPTVSSITALGSFPPANIPGVSYPLYSLTVSTDSSGNPLTTTQNITSGPNQGLLAEIVPISLSVTAFRPSGAEVKMQRTVEVALIPVFQFGVFSDSDLSYFPGPSFDFAGLVHTNGNLFLADSSSNGLIFHSKIVAAGEVIRDKLANGGDVASEGRTGPVYIPNTAAGCDLSHPATNCLNLGITQGSYIGGPPPTGTANPSWTSISTGTFNGYILSKSTGGTALSLPFVSAGVGPVQIIRKPPAGEAAGTALSQSRLYNKAEIRILLADDLANLHPERGPGSLDADDVALTNEAGTTYPGGVPVTGIGNTFFAYANIDCTAALNYYCDPADFKGTPTGFTGAHQWPLINGWMRVEIKKSDGTWVGVTREWLKIGFASGLVPPAAPGSNTVHPDAILILQQQADRNDNGVISNGKVSIDPAPQQYETTAITGANNQYTWYPINFYDAREGEVRDTSGPTTCAPNGVMNTVELDVGNLRRWLTGATGSTGTQTDSASQNGYVLYFSDRRGMKADLNAAPVALTGEYGFEDTINSSSAAGTPDGLLDPNNPGTTQSPEDVDQNGLLDNWGAVNVGDGFGVSTAGAPPNPYLPRVGCTTVARKNWVSGARHTLRLVDGSLGNLPTRPDGTGGFTVASENPVYVLGNYNANAGGFGAGSSAAAVIADTVTLLSNSWSDATSLAFPTSPGSRVASDTWYRMAIAAGKNINFPQPTSWGAAQDYGTDGGVHNFLRYLENWGGRTLWYQGSLVSLFYSQYHTSIFKCCSTVYSPPTRQYSFDPNFLDPTKLPPGTPMFQDVDNLSYRQDFTPY
jgi:hypothetical protein